MNSKLTFIILLFGLLSIVANVNADLVTMVQSVTAKKDGLEIQGERTVGGVSSGGMTDVSTDRNRVTVNTMGGLGRKK